MFNRNAPRLTKLEIQYLALVRALPCRCCKVFGITRPSIAHHIKDGGRRMGHRFVLNLCKAHHTGEFMPGENYGLNYSVHKQHRQFMAAFGTERQLWNELQDDLDLPRTGWPVSKILPRRVVA